MTIETEAKITLAAEDQATAIVRKLRIEVDRLTKSLSKLANIKLPAFQTSVNPATASKATDALTTRSEAAALAALRKRWTFENRMSRQRASEAQAGERQRRAYDSAAMADIRRRMAFAGQMARQRIAEIRALERERERAANAADRDAASTLRRQIAGDRWRFALRERMDRKERQDRQRDRRETVGRGRDAYSHGRDAIRDTTRPVGIAALAGSATAAAATRKILGSEAAVDAAEINTRSYGGLSQEAARTLRDSWAAPLAESLGVETTKLLTAWTDATKLGVPAAGAKAFAELATKTSSAWEVSFEQTADILGTVNSILTSKGAAFDVEQLRSVANTVQHLAAKQSTTPEKLLSFLQRGAGAAQVLGMSQEAGLAFGSASTSLGNQAGQSGRLFDYIASRVIELPRLTKGNGDQADQAKELVKALGYGSAENMDRQRRSNPDEFLPDFLGRFNRIKDPKKQDQAIRFFTGREWLGEFGRMAKGIDTYKEAVKLSKEAKGLDAISEVWNLHRLKLAFVFKQFRAGWLNILGEFGKVLSPMARQAGDVFLAWTAKLRNGGLAERFKAGIEGFVNGLGFRDLPALLEGILGKPGEGSAGAIESWRSAARGFGQGLRDAGDAIKSFFGAFTGGNSDPEAIGRWTARILAFSAALVIASPAVTVLSGVASGILALGAAATTALAAFKIAGAGGAAAGAVGAISAAVWTTAGGLIGAAFLAAIANRLNILTPPDMSKGWGRGILEFLDPGLARRILGDAPATADPPAKVEKQSHNGAFDQRGLIQKANVVTADIVEGLDRLGRTLNERLGAKVQTAALSTTSTAALGGFTGSTGSIPSPAGPDAPRAPIPGFPQAGVPTDGGPRVPGWFGRGRGQGAPGAGMPDPGTGAGTGPYKPVLDHIAQSEGTAGKAGGGYSTSLDYGRWLPGGKEQDLTKLTLDEIDQLQTGMLANPENRQRYGNGLGSSAIGRYQIVRKTLRGLRQRLGLKGDALFDQDMQDRLGAELVRGRGANATGLGQEWASLRGDKLARAVDLAKTIPQGAPTRPSPREAVSGTGNGSPTTDGDLTGLRLKSREAVAGGASSPGIVAALKGLQAEGLPGGFGRVTALNDLFHKDRRSKHNEGLAGDLTILDPRKSAEAAEAIRAKLRGAGLRDDAFKVLDEYKNPSGHATGGHLHVQFNSRDAAERYAKATGATPKAQDVADDIVRPGQGFGPKPPTAEDLTAKVPMPAPRGPGAGVPSLEQGGTGFQRQGGQGGGGVTVHAPVTIHAGNQSPQELAGHVQRHITEAWNFRSHDLEPELT